MIFLSIINLIASFSRRNKFSSSVNSAALKLLDQNSLDEPEETLYILNSNTKFPDPFNSEFYLKLYMFHKDKNTQPHLTSLSGYYSDPFLTKVNPQRINLKCFHCDSFKLYRPQNTWRTVRRPSGVIRVA